MNNWYNNLTKSQKKFIYSVAIAVPVIIGFASDSPIVILIAYAPLVVLIYLKLGGKK